MKNSRCPLLALKRELPLAMVAVGLQVLLLLVPCCQPRFERNPSLSLLRAERGQFQNGHTLFRPLWTLDGSQILYLRAEGVLSEADSGVLWRVDAEGSNATQLVEGFFSATALAGDGLRLALAQAHDSAILLASLNGPTTDTIRVSHGDIIDLEFSRTFGTKIYYSSGNSGIYSINTDGTAEEAVDSTLRWAQFDLTLSDSIVEGAPHGTKPKISPSGYRIARVTTFSVPGTHTTTDDIVLTSITKYDAERLEANPYEVSWIRSPSWSPDGSRLLFCACELGGDPAFPSEGELWILDNVPAEGK